MSTRQARNPFSRTLFVNDNGTALRFYIRPCAEKPRLRALIEERGGVIADRIEENVFRLVLPCDRPPQQSSRNLRVDYVHDCVSENKLLPTEKYGVIAKTDAELDDELDIENKDLDNFMFCIRTTARDTKCRREYTAKDDQKIINFIVKNQCCADVRGRAIWVEMETHFCGDRTWQSLKERFLKRIIPNLLNYKLPDETYKMLKIGHGSWTKEDADRLQARRKVKAKRRIVSSDESSGDSDSTVEFNKTTFMPAQKATDSAGGTSSSKPEVALGQNAVSSKDTNSVNPVKIPENFIQDKSPDHVSELRRNSETVTLEEAPLKSGLGISSPKNSLQSNCKSPSSSEALRSDKVSTENRCTSPPQASKRRKTTDTLSTRPIQETDIINNTEDDEPNPSTTRQPFSVEVNGMQIISKNSDELEGNINVPGSTKATKPLQFSKLQTRLAKKQIPQRSQLESYLDSIQRHKVYFRHKPVNSTVEKTENKEPDNARKTLASELEAGEVSPGEVLTQDKTVNECQEVGGSQNTDCSMSLLDGGPPLLIDKPLELEPILQRNSTAQTESVLCAPENSKEREEDDDEVDSLDIHLMNNSKQPLVSQKLNDRKRNITQEQSQVPSDSQCLDGTSWNGEESLTALPFLDTLPPDVETSQLNVSNTECSSRISDDQTKDCLLSIENSLKAWEARASKGRKLVLLNDTDIVISRSEHQKMSSDFRTLQEWLNSRLLNAQVESVMRKPLSVLSKRDDKVLESYLTNNKTG